MATAKKEEVILDTAVSTVAFVHNAKINPPTTIPLKSVPKFSTYTGGVGEGEAILLVSSTGASKTKTAIRLYILDVVDYIFKNPDLDIEIVFFSLELTSIDIYLNILSAMLHEKYGNDYSPQYLQNREVDNPLSDETLAELDALKPELDFLDKKLKIVDNIYRPDEIYSWLKLQVLNKSGKFVNAKWVKNNPKKNVIVIVDTINALQADKGKTEYESIKYWSEHYTKKVLKKQYKAAIINIQQTDKASTTAQYSGRGTVVEEKFTPKLESLAKVKTTPDDHTLVISIYNPYNYEVPEYADYDITILKNHFRYLKVIKASFVEAGKGVGVYIDNANLQIEELPRGDRKLEMAEFYKKRGLIKQEYQQRLEQYGG